MTHTRHYHGLDALRALAMLLGLLVHSTLPYTQPHILEGFEPGAQAPDLAMKWWIAMGWAHQWRMPVFFILAGFFTAMVIERKGPTNWLADRTVRIGAVFVALMLGLPLVGLKEPSELHHFWFLWFLIQFYVLTFVAQRLGLAPVFSPLLWLFDRPWRLALLLLPLAALTRFSKRNLLSDVVPYHITDVELQGLTYYGFFFLIGTALWARRGLIDWLSQTRVWVSLIAVALAATGLLAPLGQLENPPVIAFLIALPIGQLAIILGFIGGAQALVTRSNAIVQFLVDSAYTVYIIHLYIMVWVASEFILAGWHQDNAIPLSIVATGLASIAFYLTAVRYTPLARILSPRQSPAK